MTKEYFRQLKLSAEGPNLNFSMTETFVNRALSNHEGDNSEKVSQKVISSYFQLHRILPPSSNFGHLFLELNSKGPHPSSEKEEENYRLLITSSIKREIRHFNVAVAQLKQKRKKRFRKSAMHVQKCYFAHKTVLMPY